MFKLLETKIGSISWIREKTNWTLRLLVVANSVFRKNDLDFSFDNFAVDI